MFQAYLLVLPGSSLVYQYLNTFVQQNDVRADLETVKEVQNKTFQMVETLQAALLNQANADQTRNENSTIIVSNNIRI